MPRHPRIETENQQIGQAQSHVIPTTGDLDRSDFASEFTTVDTPMQSDHVKELLFMEELVCIEIPKGRDAKNEEQFIDVGNNGVRQFIERGKAQWVKRKFVEVLARAKREEITTPEFTDATGARATRIDRTPALIHNFMLIEDKNPNGRAWLSRILAEA